MKGKKQPGTVYLIGGGPGDPGLMTLKGKEILSRADAVVYDALVSKKLLSFASVTARKIYAGKRGGRGKAFQQQDLNKLLAGLAQKHKIVARLKGGDPFIFGRGGEEMLSLREAGIPFKVIPGITAALGAAAYTRIPLTHREYTSQVVLVTGHEAWNKERTAIDWRELASGDKTVIFYMGLQTLPFLTEKLKENGLPGDTPMAVIQNATAPDQRVVEGNLGNIGIRVRRAGLKAPCLIFLGNVVRLRRKGKAGGEGPLSGSCVMITRARHQAGEMSKRLKSLGAQVIEFPVIRIEPPVSWKAVDREMSRLERYDWIFFTSVNGVEKFFERFFERKNDFRKFLHLKVGAIGPATARTLEGYHLRPDFVPSDYVSEAFADTFLKKTNIGGKKILLVRAEGARRVLRKKLEKRKAEVAEVAVYRIRSSGSKCGEVIKKLRAGDIDLVSFTSPSTVEHFLSLVGKKTFQEIRRKPLLASIGPVTGETMKRLGLKIACQPRRYTIPDLVSAIAKILKIKKSRKEKR